MGSMNFEVAIDRPADEVWAYLADPSHEVEWQDGVISSSHAPAGPIGVGTLKKKTRQTPLGRQSFSVKYTRVDPAGREWEDVVVDGSVLGSTGHYRVVPDGAACRVLLDVVMRSHGLARLFMPMIDRVSRRDLAGGLDSLRTIMERDNR